MMETNNKGTILVITIWILMLLSLLALGFSYRMGLELKLVKYNRDDLKAFYTAKAGIYRTILELQNDEARDYDCYTKNWGNNKEAFRNYKLGEGRFTIKNYSKKEEEETLFGATDEQSKINVNEVPVNMLSTLLELLEEDKEIATNIMDWIDADSTPGNQGEGFGAEDGFYESLGKKYPCKNQPLEAMEELLMIRDIEPEIFDKIKDYTTIYGQGTVNINTASSLVLQALGLEETLVEKIIAYRAGEDQLEGTIDDEIFNSLPKLIKNLDEAMDLDNREIISLNNLLSKKPAFLDIKSNYFKIISEGTVNQISKTIEVVVKRNKDKPLEIIYWKEN